MSDLVAVSDFSINELVIEELRKENSSLKSQIIHLQNNIQIPKLTMSVEERIILKQLEDLHDISFQRSFTLEDTRKLDLLIKNLRLIRSEATEMIDINSKDLSQDELIAIAQG